VVYIFRGGAEGLSLGRADRITANRAGLPISAHQGDYFGWSVDMGDVTGDGRDDLAVGIPHKSVDRKRVGAAALFFGGASGLGNGGLYIRVHGLGVGAEFGDGVQLTDWVGNGHRDLLVSGPLEDLPDAQDAGAVHAFVGAANGVTAAGHRKLTVQSIRDRAPRGGDLFGLALPS
jgi:hypothetical protein